MFECLQCGGGVFECLQHGGGVFECLQHGGGAPPTSVNQFSGSLVTERASLVYMLEWNQLTKQKYIRH